MMRCRRLAIRRGVIMSRVFVFGLIAGFAALGGTGCSSGASHAVNGASSALGSGDIDVRARLADVFCVVKLNPDSVVATSASSSSRGQRWIAEVEDNRSESDTRACALQVQVELPEATVVTVPGRTLNGVHWFIQISILGLPAAATREGR
jgi:hypothetical protein